VVGFSCAHVADLFLPYLQLKKILSSIPEAPINVESLANDVDVSAVVTRETFAELAKPVLERVKAPLEQARASPFLWMT
jgi:molecular chaperone DnaK (HSP70)